MNHLVELELCGLRGGGALVERERERERERVVEIRETMILILILMKMISVDEKHYQNTYLLRFLC